MKIFLTLKEQHYIILPRIQLHAHTSHVYGIYITKLEYTSQEFRIYIGRYITVFELTSQVYEICITRY